MVSRLSSLTRHLVVGHHHNLHQCRQFHRYLPIAFQNAHISPSTTLLQQRCYHINLAKETSDDDDDDINNNIHQTTSTNNLNDIDSDTLQSYNLLTRRLYRTLLKSAKNGIDTANEGNTIDCSSSIGGGSTTDTSLKKDWILLQPPIDQRKYGFAKIVAARRGIQSLSSLLKPDMSNFNCSNKAVKSMNKEEVGISMEILKFIHVQLGGSRYDDLEEYYLGSSLIPDEMDVTKILGKGASGKHSDGHYTQFIDDDPERGEGGEEVGDDIIKPDNLITIAEEDTDDDEEDDNEEDYPDDVDEWDDSDDESDNNEQLELDESILVTSQDLQNAIKIAFRAPLLSQYSSSSTEEKQTTSTIISRRHRDAINACSELSQQLNLWGNKSSVYTDYEHGVRVVVSSCLMMRQGVSKQNRFAYRVRVENIVDIIDEMKKEHEDSNSIEGSSKDAGIEEEKSLSEGAEHRAIQLLGRSWTISERGQSHKTSTSLLQRLLEEGVIANTGDNIDSAGGEDTDEDELRVVQTVTEPRTGAVGHLPVLGPGEVFEYMSGADISTPTGAMEGAFHMAKVNMQTIDSAHIGDDVDALKWKADDERLFDVRVARFGLVADEDIETRATTKDN